MFLQQSTLPGGNLSKAFINLLPDSEYIVEVSANVEDIQSKTGSEKAITSKHFVVDYYSC